MTQAPQAIRWPAGASATLAAEAASPAARAAAADDHRPAYPKPEPEHRLATPADPGQCRTGTNNP